MRREIIYVLSAILLSAGYAYAEDRVNPDPHQPGDYQIYPDPVRTPGVTNPEVNDSNIWTNICNPEWHTKSIRPPVSYTNRLKRKQIGEYGYRDRNPRHYEEDHMIPLELGGDPTDPGNLWPEPWKTKPNAGDKDKVENYLHDQVCKGKILLHEAQKEITTDWVAVYNQMMAEGWVNPWTPRKLED
jgi:hypothetical protein